jgi:RimJ/RimL family protein N-acetyltransferase
MKETTEWIETVSNRPNNSIFSNSLRKSSLASNNQKMIGIIGLNTVHRLLYFFHPDFWGAGYCTEALRWFLVQLFENQSARTVIVTGVRDGMTRV